MSALAAKHGAVNLGQGFPDFGWPEEMLEAAARALTEASNQYPPSRGLPRCVRPWPPTMSGTRAATLTPSKICVTSGATEALGAAILATVEPGDEVLIFTPAYDSYAPMIRRAGGEPGEIALQPPNWRIDREMLSSWRSVRRTRAILFNNPHNPDRTAVRPDELEVRRCGRTRA